MRRCSKLVVAAACVALILGFASHALATGSAKPIWAGQGFDPEARDVKITSAGNSASSFSFTWWVFGFTHEPGKGINSVKFTVNTDPSEVKNVTLVPPPGWCWAGPNTVVRDHITVSSGTTPFLLVHFGITGTETHQNSETTDFILSPITVHFGYVTETSGVSTTTAVGAFYTGVGVDHHENNPTEEQSWGWIKALFK
jgi:hypothetical protein